MKKIALLPLRHGSKGIPGKNVKKMLGRPLYSWVLAEAIASDLDVIFVATDYEPWAEQIRKEYHWCPKVQVFMRSAHSATDTAATETVMQEWAAQYREPYELLVLLQATSPLTTAADINRVLEAMYQGATSALTVVRTHRFIWDEKGEPLNYNPLQRPRRQDFDGLLVENGAVYATTRLAFEQSHCRMSGCIQTVEMPDDSLTEIDTLTDWDWVEQRLAQRAISQKQQGLITHLVLDVDGVFTEGGVYYNAEGEALKRFDMRDGMGLEIIRQQAVEVIVITSEASALVASRMKKLGISDVFLGVKDKFAFLRHHFKHLQLSWAQVAYVGDDVNDLAGMCTAAWSFAPANATLDVQRWADIQLTHPSGHGAIREVCQWITHYNRRFI